MDELGAVVAAAEMLLAYGWDVVNVAEFTNSNHAYALMRRSRAHGQDRGRRRRIPGSLQMA